MPAKTPDVAVVGAGLVGLCSALALQRAGLSTLLMDSAKSTASASFGNAGHIAVEQAQPLANPQALRSAAGRLFAFGGPLDFRIRDLSSWAGWAMRYCALSGASQAQAGALAIGALLSQALPSWRRLVDDRLGQPDLLTEAGHLVVWEREATARKGRQHWARAATGDIRIRNLFASEQASLTSELARPMIDGIGFEGTGQVASPSTVMTALATAFLSAGGERLDGEVRRLRNTRDRVGLELESHEIWPGLAVMAGGVGSGPLLRGLGHVAPIVAERGYHIETQTDGWAELPPVVFEDRGMIATRFGDWLRATSFVEFARPDAPADPRKWKRLERHAHELGLPMRGPFKHWMGARPTLPDYLPAIGRSGRAKNLIYAFGHQHLGLTLAPLTGELVADLALERTPAVTLQPFDLDRFSSRRAGRSPTP